MSVTISYMAALVESFANPSAEIYLIVTGVDDCTSSHVFRRKLCKQIARTKSAAFEALRQVASDESNTDCGIVRLDGTLVARGYAYDEVLGFFYTDPWVASQRVLIRCVDNTSAVHLPGGIIIAGEPEGASVVTAYTHKYHTEAYRLALHGADA